VSQPSLTQGGIHLGRGEGKSFWLLTDRQTFKAVGDDTNGAFVLSELTAGAEFGPPPHIHRYSDEGFYILEGIFDFSLGGQVFTAGVGAFVHLPKFSIHDGHVVHRVGHVEAGRSSDLSESPRRVLVQQAGDQRLIRQTLSERPFLDRL
jgi:Cupin domain